MYSLEQTLELAAAEYQAKEAELTPIWQLARSANVHKNHLLQTLKDRGYEIHYPETDGPVKPPVPSIAKADVRKLMGLGEL
jgi:hypothetical protein